MPIRPNGLILAENGEKLFFFLCFGKSLGIKYKVEIVFTTITLVLRLPLNLDEVNCATINKYIDQKMITNKVFT